MVGDDVFDQRKQQEGREIAAQVPFQCDVPCAEREISIEQDLESMISIKSNAEGSRLPLAPTPADYEESCYVYLPPSCAPTGTYWVPGKWNLEQPNKPFSNNDACTFEKRWNFGGNPAMEVALITSRRQELKTICYGPEDHEDIANIEFRSGAPEGGYAGPVETTTGCSASMCDALEDYEPERFQHALDYAHHRRRRMSVDRRLQVINEGRRIRRRRALSESSSSKSSNEEVGDSGDFSKSLRQLQKEVRNLSHSANHGKSSKTPKVSCVVHTNGEEYCRERKAEDISLDQRRLQEAATDYWSALGVQYLAPAPTKFRASSRSKSTNYNKAAMRRLLAKRV
jgi:hypothetical protein